MLALPQNKGEIMAKKTVVVIVNGYRNYGRVGRLMMSPEEPFIVTHPTQIADRLVEIKQRFAALGINHVEHIVVKIDPNLLSEVDKA